MAEPAPVYFVSCGPGSPEFLTVAGLRAIERSRSVLAPEHYAEAFRDLLAGKEVASPFLMKHDEVASWVESRLSLGPVAFLVPGDFSTFCPFQSFVSRFRPHSRVIPGVSAHVAAAALVGKTFDMPGVAHCTVVTSPKAYARDGGRVGLHELMIIDDGLRDAIVAAMSVTEIRKRAVQSGMITLSYDGFRKVREGLTTIEEVLQAAGETVGYAESAEAAVAAT